MKQYPEDEKIRMRVHGTAKQCRPLISSSLTTMMVNQLVTHVPLVACLSAMKLSVMESSSTVNSKKQNLAFMTP